MSARSIMPRYKFNTIFLFHKHIRFFTKNGWRAVKVRLIVKIINSVFIVLQTLFQLLLKIGNEFFNAFLMFGWIFGFQFFNIL